MEQDGELRPASVITLSALLENMESGVALLEMGRYPPGSSMSAPASAGSSGPTARASLCQNL